MTLKRGIHGAFSTNCMSAVGSKASQRDSDSRNPATEPTSATQRAGAGLRSLPITRTAMPKAIGTQMASGQDRHRLVASPGSAQKKVRSANTPKIIVNA